METHTTDQVAATSVEAMPNLLTPPKTLSEKMKHVGPGIVVAATGVGTADLITSIVIGTQFGTTFIWAILVGSILKYFLNEGVGRWHLASERTMVQGWQQLGKWATGYFGVYSFGASFTGRPLPRHQEWHCMPCSQELCLCGHGQ